MELVNRVALIVRPKRRFAEWVNSIDRDEGPPSFDLESERNSPTIYLVESGDLELPDLSELVDRYALEIFEAELEGWWTDEAGWPANRNPHIFRDWFDVTLSDLAWDLDETEPIYAADDDEFDAAPHACAWCGSPIEEDAPVVTVSLKGPHDGAPAAPGTTVELAIGGRVVPAVIPAEGSDAAREGILALVTFCGEPCAVAFTKAWERERGALNS